MSDRNVTIMLVVNGITQVAAILTFGALGYHFGHWWIGLFALLFLYNTKVSQKKTYHEGDEEDDE